MVSAPEDLSIIRMASLPLPALLWINSLAIPATEVVAFAKGMATDSFGDTHGQAVRGTV